MTYNKYLIVASKQDPAGVNITTQLSQYPQEKFRFHLVEGSILEEKNLDLERINQFDFVIFASKHATNSENPEKTLSIHAPGNPKQEFNGGKPGKLSPSSAFFNKQCFEIMNKNAKELNLRNYKVTLEATHHGPFIDKPCAFIEIGSTISEWKDRKAGFVLAKTILDTIETLDENPYNEIAIGIGGPHYCPGFNKIQEKSNYALSHIIPQYILPLTPEIVKEALDKTIEEVDLAIIDWKGVGNSDERERIIEILEKMYVRWKKVSEVKKGI